MKKTLTVISILILASLISFVYLGAEKHIKFKTYPKEFSDFVSKYSEMYSVPENIIYAVIKVESGFESDAVSNKGAIGLMQITPETFDWLLTKEPYENASHELLYTPEINIRYGTLFLSMLQGEFGSWETSYAAYNAGRTRVKKWLADEKYSQNGILTNIPYEETAKYVKKVSSAAQIYDELYFTQK